MNRRAFVSAVVLAVAFATSGATAYAQGIRGEITFPFVAAGKEMAAGKYSVEMTPNGQLQLTGADGGRVLMPVVTLLCRHDRNDPESVSDRTNDRAGLSEIWMPGQDGYLVAATKGPHSHTVVGGSKPGK